jgi:hypothetical protein
MQTMRSYYDKTGTVALNAAGCEAVDMLCQMMNESSRKQIYLCDIARWAAEAVLPKAGPSEQSMLAAEIHDRVFGLWLAQTEGRA